jgi:hypothetical protein
MEKTMASRYLYILRVRLSWAKGVWREIAIRGDQTLHDLHRGILEAFEWSQDDAYSFYLNNDIKDARYVCMPGHEKRDTHSTRLDTLHLDEEQEILYVFGDGERNQFPIRVMSIEVPEHGATYPDVVDERGESPEQELAYEED